MDKAKDGSGYSMFDSSRDLEEKILDYENAALVYVAKKDQLTHIEVVGKLAG